MYKEEATVCVGQQREKQPNQPLLWISGLKVATVDKLRTIQRATILTIKQLLGLVGMCPTHSRKENHAK